MPTGGITQRRVAGSSTVISTFGRATAASTVNSSVARSCRAGALLNDAVTRKQLAVSSCAGECPDG